MCFDVCGALKTKTAHGAVDVHVISGALYFARFIDDCFRKASRRMKLLMSSRRFLSK